MTYYISANNQNTTHAATMLSFRAFMTTASSSGPGWTCVGSGDGLSAYSNSNGSAISNSTSGAANSLNNPNAWFVLKSPDASRQFLFQRKAVVSDWKVTYSRQNFNYTSASASTAPALTNNANNGVSDGSVLFDGTLFVNNQNSYAFNICAGDQSEGSSFYFFTYGVGQLTTGATTMIIMDAIDAAAMADGDQDPCVIYVNANANPKDANDGVLFNQRLHKNADATGKNHFQGFVCYNLTSPSPSQSFLKMTVSSYGSASSADRATLNLAPYNMSTNAYSAASDEALPIYYFHLRNSQTAHDSFKGGSHLMLYGLSSRSVGDTLAVQGASGTTYKVFINGFLFPWADGITLIA